MAAVLPGQDCLRCPNYLGGSGGPLFNNGGKVIGINFAMVRGVRWIDFAIPVAYGKTLLKP